MVNVNEFTSESESDGSGTFQPFRSKSERFRGVIRGVRRDRLFEYGGGIEGVRRIRGGLGRGRGGRVGSDVCRLERVKRDGSVERSSADDRRVARTERRVEGPVRRWSNLMEDGMFPTMLGYS